MYNNFKDMFDELSNIFYGQGGYKSFPVDLVEIEHGYVLTAEMPGVLKEDVKINFDNGILTIEADRKKDEKAKYLINERDLMHLKRSISFGEINEDTITAKMEHGLLIVTITTKVPEEKPKRNIVIE